MSSALQLFGGNETIVFLVFFKTNHKLPLARRRTKWAEREKDESFFDFNRPDRDWRLSYVRDNRTGASLVKKHPVSRGCNICGARDRGNNYFFSK